MSPSEKIQEAEIARAEALGTLLGAVDAVILWEPFRRPTPAASMTEEIEKLRVLRKAYDDADKAYRARRGARHDPRRHETPLHLQGSFMSQEIATRDDDEGGDVPAFLRKMSTGASFGNIDASDLKPPRLKVLAGQSPEVINGMPGALPGNFG